VARGYYTSRISENLEETPEGYLVARNVPIARTGPQDYKVSDLPQDTARDLGVDTSNPGANITIYRPPEEVFHPDTLKSFEGKPITMNHPEDFVDPTNYTKVAMGHVQNVRKGAEPLGGDDDGAGEWPVIADVIITAEPLLSRVKNKQMRELSCGYDFGIKRNEDNPDLIDQCSIVGNHVAVVPHGRAGSSVRIVDAAPEQVLETPAPVVEPTYPPIPINFTTKEKQSVSTKNKLLRLFMGKHLIELARATDADPEKIMDAAEALQAPEAGEAAEQTDKKGKDNDPAAEGKELDKDHEPANDRRRAMHDALDDLLDARDKKKGKDSDIAELKDLLDQFLSEEEQEPEHAAADEVGPADPAELESVLGADDEACPECGLGKDACECEDDEADPGQEVEASGEEFIEDADEPDEELDEDHEPAMDRAKAKDAKAKDAGRARANDAAAAVLRMLRPSIARTGDKAVQQAFNAALNSVKKTSRPSVGGGYGAFAGSARARDKAPRNPKPDRARASDAADQINKMQAYYDAARKGGK
jgi:hypothetical protein